VLTLVNDSRRIAWRYNPAQRGASTERSAYYQQIHRSNRRDLDWLHRSTGYPLCVLAIYPSLSLACPTRRPALTRFGWNYWQHTLFVPGSVSFEFDLRESIDAYFGEVEY
jgi:hypothetical protein